MSVLNASTCNAQDTTGCSQQPREIPLGASPQSVAVNQATDTIYVLDPGTPGKVSVINGATCNATKTTGCGTIPPTATVGNDIGIQGLAVDQATDTVYVDNTGNDTVSVINGAICNGHDTSGCGQTPVQVRVGRQSWGFITIDPATGLIYVSNHQDDTVSVINGATCNGHDTSGCQQLPPAIPAGANPAWLSLDQATRTVYVNDNGAGTVSFFRFQVPQRPTQVTAASDHGKVVLHWQPGYDGGLPVIYHVIPSPPCPRCRGLTTPSTSGLPFTIITCLTRGQTYTFKVRATDAAGTGPASVSSTPVSP